MASIATGETNPRWQVVDPNFITRRSSPRSERRQTPIPPQANTTGGVGRGKKKERERGKKKGREAAQRLARTAMDGFRRAEVPIRCGGGGGGGGCCCAGESFFPFLSLSAAVAGGRRVGDDEEESQEAQRG